MAANDFSNQNEPQPPGPMTWLRRNFWPITTIVVVAIVSAVVVSVFKKPGQMSVIESQAMDMSTMTPPKGALPVAIATVSKQKISGSVIYTGTAQAYEDEDIYSRIEGRISQMPVYPGDQVRRGQLLVMLDPPNNSEYLSRYEETKYSAQAAEHDAGIAKQEFKQKQYQLEATQDAEQATQKAVDQARANLEYWTPEMKREAILLQRQVISQQEYDNENAQFKTAQAKVDEAQAQQRQATKTKLAAQAEFEAAMHHIGHRFAMAKQAEAVEKAARLIDDYRRIVARGEGVITKRLVSPGVVVRQGTMILKVAHINRMRLQAEVASADVDKIQVGAPVYYQASDSTAEQQAQVTSIFPAADPSSRTFIVEALITNSSSQSAEHPPDKSRDEGNLNNLRKYQFLPGQYVVMRIVTGEAAGLVIPTKAISWNEGLPQVWKAVGGSPSTVVQYTCLMHPEIVSDKPGHCPKCGMQLVLREPGKGGGPDSAGPLTAQLIEIKTGISNGDKTQVLSGLSAGDKVVYEGQTDLQPGMLVFATQWADHAPATLPSAGTVAGNRLDASNNWTTTQASGDLRLRVSMSPSPPKSGANAILVTVEQGGKSVITGAKITGKSSMPTMDMSGPDLHGAEKGQGNYELTSNFSSGLWQAKLTIEAPGQQAQPVTIDVEVP